eukprot:gene17713-19484_t
MVYKSFTLKEHAVTPHSVRGDVVKGTAEIFFRKLNSQREDQATPVFNVENIQFIFIKKHGLYFVTTTKFNVGPTYVIELLNRIANICKDYCGVLNEESIRCNFTLIYEILDEVLDYGYPQTTSTEKLKSFIFNDVHLIDGVANLSSQVTGPNIFGADKMTLPSTASNLSVQSSSKKGGRKNEVFIDVLERLTALFAANGKLIRSEIDGFIQVKSFLAGNPEIRIGLSDDLTTRKGSRGKIILDDFCLHDNVDVEAFERNSELNIMPPDGEFIAMNYHLSGEMSRPLPFKLQPYISEGDNEKSIKVEFTLSCELPHLNAASNIIIRLPVPRATVSVSHDVSTGSKTVEFKGSEKTIYWGIKKMSGGKSHVAKFKINLPFISASSRQEIGPISVDFEAPMYVCSGITIKYLKVFEKNNLYTPMRWKVIMGDHLSGRRSHGNVRSLSSKPEEHMWRKSGGG